MTIVTKKDLKHPRGRKWAGFQVRELKSQGMSNRAIASRLKISPTTVKKLMSEPEGDEERLVNRMKEIARAYRTKILQEITSTEEFKIIFGDDLGETYKLSVANDKLEVYLRAGKSGYGIEIGSVFTATKEDLTEEEKESREDRTEV